jgi:hypothetical protein
MSAAVTSAINPTVLQSILSSLNITPQQAVPGSPTSPINQFITQENAANAANSQRGAVILNLLAGQGKAQLAMNQQGYQNQLGQINNDLTSRGLFNSTIAPNLEQGAQNWLNQANEQVNENTAMNVANMANSFTQQAPNLGLLSSLLSQGGGGRVSAAGVNTGGIPGFQQPGSMLDSGGGGLNVNNEAQSGYNSAMQGTQGWGKGGYGGGVMGNAMNAAYGFNGQTAWQSDPYMTSVPMQNTAASQTPTGPGSLSVNGQQVYGPADPNVNGLTDPYSILTWLNMGGLS